MPLYEYLCPQCDTVQPIIRAVRRRNALAVCDECLVPMERVLSLVSVKTWNPSRRFPNLSSTSHDGARAFDSELEYNQHLEKTGLVEFAHDGLVQTPHGNTVVLKDKPEKQREKRQEREMLSEAEFWPGL